MFNAYLRCLDSACGCLNKNFSIHFARVIGSQRWSGICLHRSAFTIMRKSEETRSAVILHVTAESLARVVYSRVDSFVVPLLRESNKEPYRFVGRGLLKYHSCSRGGKGAFAPCHVTLNLLPRNRSKSAADTAQCRRFRYLPPPPTARSASPPRC